MKLNLPFLKSFRKKVLPLYYLVLVLRDEKAEAIIFEELSGIIKIVGFKEQKFPASIDKITPEQLLESLDNAISEAESPLPENVQTQKTIFGVKESWTENDQIKKEYLTKLKKASEELSLVPIGFLVISQAIAHYLQKEEGAPVSGILTEINKNNVTVTLLRAGKIVESRSSDIHESVPFTVDTLLKHFNTSEVLPSRIILFNGKEDLSQEFISHPWSKSLPFLHLPQITNLPAGFDAKSVLFGAATQMGFHVAVKELPKNETEPEISETIQEQEEKTGEKFENIKFEDVELENFGFAQDTDVAHMKEKEDVAPVTEDVEKEGPYESEQMGTFQNTSKFSERISSIKNKLINLFGLVKNFNFKGFSFSSKKITLIVPAILILLFGFIAYYMVFLKATVTLTVDPEISKLSTNITISTSQDTNPESKIIKGNFVSITENGSSSTQATGKKDVGSPAKGTVTIFNSLSSSKTLAAGTIIKSSNGLEFTLDSSVTINAVASHSADETVNPEKVNANVTASELGKESNLPSGTKFSIASFDTSEMVAKNDNPFSGGTKKEVTIVSKNDTAKLEELLIKQLEEKAKEDLRTKLSSSQTLVPGFISEDITNKSLSARVGDETNQVTLNGTVDYKGIYYNNNDLIEFIKPLVSKNIPSTQELDPNNIKSTVDVKDHNTEEIIADLDTKTLLLPKIDKNKLIKDLKGKSLGDANEYLHKISQITDIKIDFSPNIPFIPKGLPSVEKNIIIVTKLNN